MDEDGKMHLLEVVKKIDTLMVATTATNGTMHARPMALAEVEESGVLWFVTGKSSDKMTEVRADSRAVATGQDKSLYVSISGNLQPIDDRKKIAALWKEAWRAWFPEGKEDPNIVLLALRPEAGEYWDQSGGKGLTYVFEAAKAILAGKRMDVNGEPDPKQHAKVVL